MSFINKKAKRKDIHISDYTHATSLQAELEQLVHKQEMSKEYQDAAEVVPSLCRWDSSLRDRTEPSVHHTPALCAAERELFQVKNGRDEIPSLFLREILLIPKSLGKFLLISWCA